MASRPSTNLATSMVEREVKQHDGYVSRTMSMSGAESARIAAAVEQLRNPNVEQLLTELDGQKVTMLRTGSSMIGASLITAVEGKLFREGHSYLPKGSSRNGYQLPPRKTLDVVPGYGRTALFGARVEATLAQMPAVEDITPDVLGTIGSDIDAEYATLAAFGTVHLPSGAIPASVWFIYAYDPEADTADGVLFVPPTSEGYSEHGSVYGRQLDCSFGFYPTFTPVRLDMLMDLTDEPGGYEEAIRLASAPSPAFR